MGAVGSGGAGTGRDPDLAPPPQKRGRGRPRGSRTGGRALTRPDAPRPEKPRADGALTNQAIETATGRKVPRRTRIAKSGGRVITSRDLAVTKKLAKLARTQGDATLPTIPGVQSLSLATRHLNGGRDHFIELVQLAALEDDPDAIKFLSVLATLSPYERKMCNFDEVCVAAGVRPSKLVGAVTSCAMEHGADVGNLVYAASHPKVVAAGIAAALKPEGQRDREMLFQHAGFIPIPKSTTVNVNASASAAAQAAAAAQGSATGLPSFGDDIRAVGAAGKTAVAQLEAAREAEGITFDGEVVPERVPAAVTRG